jgi:hypothetical protein
VGVDDAEGLAELGCGGWMIGGKEWSDEAAVDLGVEKGDADAVGGKHVRIGMGLPADQTFAAESAQVVRHLR